MAPSTDGDAAAGVSAKPTRGFIDTAVPFESVRAAVSMFGGIIDWKAHRTQTEERQKQVEADLNKTQEEIEHYKSLSDAAEEEKAQVLKELDGTRKLVEELNLELNKAETDETEAKQDSEVASLRAREVEQGVGGKASVAAETELEIARSRHAFAVSELESVKKELENSRQEYSTLLKEKEISIKNAADEVCKSGDVEKTAEDNVSLLEGEDASLWEKEFQQLDDEMRQLGKRIVTMKALQTKVDAASTCLLELKNEFSASMEGKSKEPENNDGGGDKDCQTNKELEEIHLNVAKAKEDVKALQVIATSLKVELAGEEAIVASMKKTEEAKRAEKVSSLESELGRIEMEIELLQEKKKEIGRKLDELPLSLQQATLEAEEAKLAAELASEELLKARKDAEEANAAASVAESELKAALREIDAAKSSEKIASDVMKALEESDKVAAAGSGVTLPIDEYYQLSKKAHDAEEQANNKVASASLLVEEAKKVEARSLERLEEAIGKLKERKESLQAAEEKADDANEGKLAVEQELRGWRVASQKRSKKYGDDDDVKDVFKPSAEGPLKSTIGRRDTKSMDIQQELPAAIRHRSYSSKMAASTGNDGHIGELKKKKKKKSFFPRIIMFLARKKAQSTK